MIIEQDEQFRDEAKKYRLHWNCEDCTRFRVGEERCVHEFPTHRHLKSRYEDPGAGLLFCKEFELV